ncbi:hypothetical protein Tco_1004561 [Tanacetum coccineum]|uniref:Ty3 transposon capsid-like protein domain-containing protein n=1 Tax=Tanacetum coccineum TaxID=301880 RepID=A0ABQ5FDJ2_9ASTR
MKEYCPDDEIQKLESEFWNHKMVGSDIDGYTARFHELARLVPHMVTPDSQRVNRYIRGLAPEIKPHVTSSEPATVQGAVSMANRLNTDDIKDGLFKKMENAGNKRRSNDQNRNRGRDDRNKRQRTGGNFALTVSEHGQGQRHRPRGSLLPDIVRVELLMKDQGQLVLSVEILTTLGGTAQGLIEPLPWEEIAQTLWRVDAINAIEEITLVSVHDMNVSAVEEVTKEVVKVINTAKLINVVAQVSDVGDIVSAASVATTVSAATTTTATINIVDDITLAQALKEMKSTKPKKKGIVIQEMGESTTIISSQLSSQQSHDKVKGILIEPVKKKDKILLDEETAFNLQAEFDEEERLAREKAEKEKEVNIALIETWDDIQAKIDVDHQLAKIMQAQEQEELSIEEKATLFQQLLKKRRKHFAAKRVEEKRNIPPTKAQQRKIMCTYLKNMEGYKLKDLKLKEFDSIQEMFDRAFKRVNTFEDFKTELVEGKEKIAGTKLIYMLVEKKYPLAPLSLSMMLEKKLMIDYESEMAYWLLKFIMKQLKK